MTTPEGRHDAYAPFRLPNFRLYIAGSVLTVIGRGAQSVAIGWEIYQRTGDPMDLGWFGLVEALAMLIFILPAGYLADVIDRRKLTAISMIGATLTSVLLAWLSWREASVALLYIALFCDAAALTLGRPARTALLPQLVPREVFENAVAWRTSTMQIAMMFGPAIGGFLLTRSPPTVYLMNALCTLSFLVMLAFLRLRPMVRTTGSLTIENVLAGARFVGRTRLLLITMGLDLFAVLLGGAVYLLPVFAEDILNVGEVGLGLLRAAPAAGALVTALCLAHLPPMKRAGPSMLWAVAGFGLATVVFGLSRFFWLSMLMLFLTGVADNVSVVIRHTLMQLLTPDPMRGRVSAVSSVFIGCSNQLGGFESGMVAGAFGPVISVVSGGLGTLLVVGATWFIAPQLRTLGALSEVEPEWDHASAASAPGNLPAD